MPTDQRGRRLVGHLGPGRRSAALVLVTGAALAPAFGGCAYVDDDDLPTDATMDAVPILAVHLDGTQADALEMDVRDHPDTNKVARRRWASHGASDETIIVALLEAATDADARIEVLSCYDGLYMFTGTTELADGRLARIDASTGIDNHPSALRITVTAGSDTVNLRPRDARVVEGACPPQLTEAFERLGG